MKGNIFIKRPVMAMSIAILIVLVGAISYFSLPLESYPDIAPPTVTVSATYTGASAEAVMKAVIQPLEEGINGVENMLYMTSTATNSGSASIKESKKALPLHGRESRTPVVQNLEPGLYSARHIALYDCANWQVHRQIQHDNP